MKCLSFGAAALVVMLWTAAGARAEPAWGGSCLSCHSEWQPELLSVFGHDTTANPDESATGAPDRGTLEVFQAIAGDTATLRAEVVGLGTDDIYAVELTRMRFAGVESGGELTYTGDCAWPEWGEDANYYTNPVIRHVWPTGPTTFDFVIDVGRDTTYDYYDLVFAVAGKLKAGGTLFYSSAHFYLEVLPIPSDMNEDGQVTLQDYATFQGCLGGPEVTEPPGECETADFERAKLDGDDDVDLEDFAIFDSYFAD